jgi:hypothetical protein
MEILNTKFNNFLENNPRLTLMTFGNEINLENNIKKQQIINLSERILRGYEQNIKIYSITLLICYLLLRLLILDIN